MSSIWYYVDRQGQTLGPITKPALKGVFDYGEVDLNSYVWNGSTVPQWSRISTLSALSKFFKEKFTKPHCNATNTKEGNLPIYVKCDAELLVSCQCGMKVNPEVMEEHLELVCLQRDVKCPLSSEDCNWKGKWYQVGGHLHRCEHSLVRCEVCKKFVTRLCYLTHFSAMDYIGEFKEEMGLLNYSQSAGKKEKFVTPEHFQKVDRNVLLSQIRLGKNLKKVNRPKVKSFVRAGRVLDDPKPVGGASAPFALQNNLNEADDIDPITCLVCFESYNDNVKIPKNLSCGHTFCKDCLDQLTMFAVIKCPTCRKDSQVKTLTTNYLVLDIISMLQNKKKQEPNRDPVCDEHGERLVIYCRTDQALICILCRDYGSHKGHDVNLATDELATIQRNLGDLLKQTTKRYDELVPFRDKLNQKLRVLSANKTSLQNIVESKDNSVLGQCASAIKQTNAALDPCWESDVDLKIFQRKVGPPPARGAPPPLGGFGPSYSSGPPPPD